MVNTISSSVSVSATQHELDGSDIFFARHKSISALDSLKKLIRSFFPEPAKTYMDMGTQKYRELVYEVQEVMSKKDYMRKITNEILPQINEYLNGEKFLIQTKMYLRAPRPVGDQEAEIVGWHRESFYGANLGRSFVVWTPIDGVELDNTLHFIPNSQTIPDEEIITKNVDDAFSTRDSVSHKTGMPYSPKKILKGVDLDSKRRLLVPECSSSIFSSDLIHGSGYNCTKVIRFATDYIIFPEKDWKPSFNKNSGLNGGKPVFEAF